MAYIVAKRIFRNEIVPIAESRMTLRKAQRKLREIGTFAGQLDRDADGIDGELWIEIETEQRTIETDPVCFPPESAHAALVRSGMKADEARRFLSDEHACQWLNDYYASAGHIRHFEAASNMPERSIECQKNETNGVAIS